MARLEDFLDYSGLEDQTIKAIMKILEENAHSLAQGPPGAIPASAFGGSTSGSVLGTHTSLAHQHVVNALNEMVAGLLGYRVNIQKWHSDLTYTDEDAGVVLRGLEAT